MFKRFIDGLIFGAGFAISYCVIWWAFTMVLFADTSFLDRESARSTTETQRGSEFATELETPFYTLPIDEKISQSNVIALAKYVEGDDGQVKAIITEFLKKEPGTTIFYEVGDEFSSASHYPEPDTDYGDGVVIFFTGSPARYRLTMSYADGRIAGFGDMPLTLFQQKCQATTNQSD